MNDDHSQPSSLNPPRRYTALRHTALRSCACKSVRIFSSKTVVDVEFVCSYGGSRGLQAPEAAAEATGFSLGLSERSNKTPVPESRSHNRINDLMNES
jgi:hypothetical protein